MSSMGVGGVGRNTHPQIARTAEIRTDGAWVSCRPLTVACRNCWISSGDIAAVKRLAAHRALPSRNGEAAVERYIWQLNSDDGLQREFMKIYVD